MEKKTNNPTITKSYAKKMETISPFELKNKLINMADESIKKIAHTMLNAGRGNPNWIATEPREAFFLLGQCCRSGYTYSRMGRIGDWRPVSCARPYFTFYGVNRTGLPGARDV